MDIRTQSALLAAIVGLALGLSMVLRPGRPRVLTLYSVFAFTVSGYYLASFFHHLFSATEAFPWVARVAGWMGRSGALQRTGRLQLDRLGTGVWDMLDGRRSLGRICAAFAEEHQLDPREAEIAVTQFVRELGRRGLVGLR